MPTDGFVTIDKPRGTTSFDVVERVRRASGLSQVGHGGTLDKEATGLLIVLVGKGTKLFQYLNLEVAEYRFEIELGRQTDTLDVDGEVVHEAPWEHVEAEDVRDALPDFVGTIDQVPPTYSAVKIDGKRASERAREGEDVDLDPREVTIESLELVDFDPPRATLRMRCHSGTYVRSIARDLGQSLDSRAFVTRLRRTEKAGFRVDEAIDLDSFEEEGCDAHLRSPLELVRSLPRYDADADEAEAIGYGQRPSLPETWLEGRDLDVGDPIAVADPDGELAAVARLKHDDRHRWFLQPRTVLKTSG
jgi:tRNA pseudouridine55 synthase